VLRCKARKIRIFYRKGKHAMQNFKALMASLLLALPFFASAQLTQKVVDLPTRAGVTQRMLVITPAQPKAAVVLLAGGHGGLLMAADGSMQWGKGNFLVRSRERFAEQGLVVAVLDAPSDKQTAPYLAGSRQSAEHVADVKAVIAWLRESAKVPVWLVGTSRGTQSAAYVATELAGNDSPDGIVLTATILNDRRSRAVPAMPLSKIRVPVLVVHHEQDACSVCLFSDMPLLMSQLKSNPRHELITFKGGQSTGDPCEAIAYHGFNGIEADVVGQIAAWISKK
jgi:dienelactone hydrolase